MSAINEPERVTQDRAANNSGRSLYDNNRAVDGLLRDGVQVETAASENTETVWPIDWATPEANDFALAEEVTLQGAHERRPDLVLYVNGLVASAGAAQPPAGTA